MFKKISIKEALNLVGFDNDIANTESILSEYFLNSKQVCEKLIGNVGKKATLTAVRKLVEYGFVDVYEIESISNDFMVVKSEYEKFINPFLENHMTVKEAMKYIETTNRDYFQLRGFTIYKFKYDIDSHYTPKKDIEAYKAKLSNYSFEKAKILTGLGSIALEQVANYYNLPRFNEKGFYKKDMDFLLEEQQRILKDIDENYITNTEYKNILGFSSNTTNEKVLKNAIKVPTLARIDSAQHNFKMASQLLLFRKEDVDSVIMDNEVKKIFNVMSVNNPFSTFEQYRKFKNLEFPPNREITEKAWFRFVKSKYNGKASLSKYQEMTSKLIHLTEILVELCEVKEIYHYSSRELNLRIFRNEELAKTKKIILHSFLFQLKNSLVKKGINSNIDLRTLINIRKDEKGLVKIKQIYSPEEYLDLMEYVIKIDLHLKLSYEDFERNEKKKRNQSYNRHCSSWLYILLHMTNAWRHFDVASFPRFDLSKTSINGLDLDTFVGHSLTEKDCDEIIAKIQSMSLRHSKNKKPRNFFYAGEIKRALCYSIVVCELRNRKYDSKSEYLIDFAGIKKNYTGYLNNSFFKSYSNSEFRFSSLKMNRTIMSYTNSVVRQKTGRIPLEAEKVLRGHANDKSTEIYLQLTQDHLDYITNVLFKLDAFGYSYTLLNDILDGKLYAGSENIDREKRFKSALSLKKLFGDASNIEKISDFVSDLNSKNFERETLKQYLMSLSVEELEEKRIEAELDLNPSKEDGISCLFAKCKMKDKLCHKCPYAIYHFHSLSALCSRISEKVKHFDRKFKNATTNGEKTFLANMLYGDLELLSLAIEKFGKHTISEFFINSNIENLKDELSSIESQKEYYTLQNGEIKYE